MAVTETQQELVLLDAGVFIGALLKGDTRHAEARPLVERARQGTLRACTATGILSEVYGALTWEQAESRHTPVEAATAVRLLAEPPSALVVLADGVEAALRTLALAAQHQLTARRFHDARHAATALVQGILSVYTYDEEDWQVFEANGIRIVGPPKDEVMSSDEKWITEHFEELVAHYGGKYVGIAKRKVIAVGAGANEVAKKARDMVEPTQLHIVKVPTAQEMSCLL